MEEDGEQLLRLLHGLQECGELPHIIFSLVSGDLFTDPLPLGGGGEDGEEVGGGGGEGQARVQVQVAVHLHHHLRGQQLQRGWWGPQGSSCLTPTYLQSHL